MSYWSNLLRITTRLLTLRRVAMSDISDSPLLLALLWVATGVLYVVDYVVIPANGQYQASTILLMVCGTVVSALLAASIIQRRSDAIRLSIVYLLGAFGAGVVWFVLLLMLPDEDLTVAWIAWSVGVAALIWSVAVACVFLARACEARRVWPRVILAIGILMTAMSSAQYVPILDGYLSMLAFETEGEGAQNETVAPIDAEALWPIQPQLVAASLARLDQGSQAGPPTFVVSIAAGGSQQLFGREARAVERLLSRRFGLNSGGVLLSNARADLNNVPLANDTNLTAILAGIGKSADVSRGLVVIYLTSHGGRDAALQTDLPDYTRLHEISAQRLAAALDRAKIRRRIVIVSACYSGTWIKPLTSPDTIVITAAAADRTSFGCDDSREYTVFGEALINGELRDGASLEDAFAALKRVVSLREAAQDITQSSPQVFVGDRMRDVWTAKVDPPAR